MRMKVPLMIASVAVVLGLFATFVPVFYQTPAPIGPSDCGMEYFSATMVITWHDQVRLGAAYADSAGCNQRSVYQVYLNHYHWESVF